MSRVYNYFAFLVIVFLPLNVYAQAPGPGWGVGWGATASVPLSPWLVVIIGIVVTLLAFYMLRHRGGGSTGLATLLVGLAMTTAVMHTDKIARAVSYDLTIDSKAGSETLSCGEQMSLNITTNVPEGITFSRLSPVGGAPALIGLPGECAVGQHLDQGASCSLPCSVPEA